MQPCFLHRLSLFIAPLAAQAASICEFFWAEMRLRSPLQPTLSRPHACQHYIVKGSCIPSYVTSRSRNVLKSSS